MPTKRVPTVAELAARIPADVAQRAVVYALAAAGREHEWDSETIENVIDQLKPALRALGDVPDPFNWVSGADEWWEQVSES